jgi:uncharacterized membrane protein
MRGRSGLILIEIVKLFILVIVVQSFFNSKSGTRLNRFLPTPFWIYFLPMVFGTLGLFDPTAQFPNGVFVYDFIGRQVLPMALILMLIGTPIAALLRLGGKATIAMTLGTLTMFIGAIFAFTLLSPLLPEDGHKQIGALLATWTGGSANMLAAKEALTLADLDLAPLVITDTFLAYLWMAFLLLGTNFQNKFGFQPADNISFTTSALITNEKSSKLHLLILLAVTAVLSQIMIFLGGLADLYWGFFNARAWTLLITSTLTILLACTPLKIMEKWGASKWGIVFLYMVLAGIGAKTSLSALSQTPVYLLFGILMFFTHGILMFFGGKLLKIPLYLLATASQANVGGPVSAPIVAAMYNPGATQFGVLMGLIGQVLGTYVGLIGAWVCFTLKL